MTNKMSQQERRTWLKARGAAHVRVSHAATHGGYRCDRCPNPSITIMHKGTAAVHVLCVSCFRADLNADRATRPTRAELVERVNRAIGA